MPPLTPDQRREVCAIAAVGCDRQIAARYLGCRVDELEELITRDQELARDLARAEARAELTHVRNVHDAAQEDKHWRASVWWLERRAPDRYGRRDAGAMTPAQVQRFVETLAAIIAEEVRHTADRDRLLHRLQELAADAAGAASPEPNPDQTEPTTEEVGDTPAEP